MAPTGQTGTQPPQSMQFSGSIYVMVSSTWKHSTGHTVTHSVYGQPLQLSVTTSAIVWDPEGSVNRHDRARLTHGRQYRGRGSGLADLDEHVREGRRPAKVSESGRRQRVD